MASNRFGEIFTLTSFGESHSKAVGGIIDGMPANIDIDYVLLQDDLDKRRSHDLFFNTSRNEKDTVTFLSGIFEDKTLGTPIGFYIENKDVKSNDYADIAEIYRPSHADFTYQMKYGHRDYRGGGRASARETVVRVVGGAFAKMILKPYHIKINAYVSQIGHITLDEDYRAYNLENINAPLFCPDKEKSEAILDLLKHVYEAGDTIGGCITCVIKNIPIGLGNPIYNKLEAQLGSAMLGINAVKGFEFGTGFKAASMYGSAHNDTFINSQETIHTIQNNDGGIQGGISNGNDIYFKVAFKPISSIKTPQQSVNQQGIKKDFTIKGRHDVCPVPRAVVVVEAMTAMVIVDNIFHARAINHPNI